MPVEIPVKTVGLTISLLQVEIEAVQLRQHFGQSAFITGVSVIVKLSQGENWVMNLVAMLAGGIPNMGNAAVLTLGFIK